MAIKKATSKQPDTFRSENTSDAESRVIPVIEEQVVVERRAVETGKVRISKHVTTREEIIDEPVLHDEVTVERIPVNEYVDVAPKVRYEGDVMIIPIIREELVVQRRLVVSEELRVRKRVVETRQPQSVTLRKEEVDVRRVAGDKRSGG